MLINSFIAPLAATDVEEITQQIKKSVNWLETPESPLIQFGKTVLTALIIFIIGRKLIQWSIQLVKKSFKRANMDEGVARFLVSVIRILSNVVLIVIIMEVLGLKTSSLVALIGSAGLTIGLALQGSLANFAGGVLILMLKPFRIGDYIMAMGNEGTVSGIDIFYTKLLTTDNKLVVIPNGALSNASIINVTNEPVRRLDVLLSVEYSENIERVKELLSEIIKSNEMVLKNYETAIYLNSFDSGAIKIGANMWVASENYWALKCRILEEIKSEFDKNGMLFHMTNP